MKITERFRLTWRAIRYRYRNDPGGIAFLLESVKAGDTVMDIGAHKGGYLHYLIRKTGRAGRVIAFEPQSALFGYLTNLKCWFGWDTVTIEHLALSNSISKVKLYIPAAPGKPSDSPGASLLLHKYPNGIASVEEVDSITLDAYCQAHQLQPRFLKIDVEGNEFRIIEGGLNTIRTCMPAILVEIEARHSGRDQVYHTIEVLENLGYTGYFIRGRKYIPVGTFDVDLHQVAASNLPYCNNFIFVPGGL